MDTEEMTAANRANWDARTPVHVASEFYGVDRKDPLDWFAPFEWDDLGDLGGVDVAHLQCHLGVETMGADVPWPRWPQMVLAERGWWALPDHAPRIPLLYGLKATVTSAR